MAVGNDESTDALSCLISTSTDGIWWTTSEPSSLYYCTDVEHDGAGRWVVVAGYKAVHTSTDGTTWDYVDLSSLDFTSLKDIAYGNGTWVAVGKTSDASPVIIASPDGITWSSQLDDGYSGPLVSVAYDGTGQFVAVGTAGIFKSSNGTSWTRVISSGSFSRVIYGNGFWVVTPGDLVSADAIQWQTVDIPPSLLAADDAGNWIGIGGETIYRRTSIPGL
jgi:hypothetical protein